MRVGTAGGAGFRPEFFLPYEQPADTLPAVPQSGSGISYSRELHGPNREFSAGPLFQQYREEVRTLLDGLIAFTVREDMSPAERDKISQGYNSLFHRRFEEPYSECYAELIDGAGKRALESICAMVRDDAIALHIRQAVARDLSTSLDVCEGGTVSNLIAAQRALLMSAGGIKARLWKMKEARTRAILQEEVCQAFSQRKGYLAYETHYVAAAWNHLAGELGLVPLPDPRAPGLLAAEHGFLDTCRRKVLAALTPDKLSAQLAEQCLEAFRSAAPAGALAAPYGTGIPDWFDAARDEVLLDLRLGADRLALHAFVQLDADGQRYRLRTDATLIALALLDAIHAEGLMDDMPVPRAEWRDENGQRAIAMSYGELAWQASLPDGVTVRPAWNPEIGSPDLLRIADLLKWKQAQDPACTAMTLVEVRAAIRSDDPAALVDTPPEWLADAETVLHLLVRLGDEAAVRYLDTHRRYFLERFPVGERAGLVDGAMRLGKAMSGLAACWYPDMYALLNETRPPGGATRLQRWMSQRDADAIDTVRALAEDGWGGAAPPPRKHGLMYSLMLGNNDTPMLYDAMSQGNAAGIGAWHRLLRSPAVLPYVAGALTDLLISDRKGSVSALAAAMHRGRANAVDAYGALLADPAILPRIRSSLVSLVDGTGSRLRRPADSANALMYGMDGGSAATIIAYGGLLLVPAILREIREDLPKIFGIRRGTGRPGARKYHRSPLWWAMNRGHAQALDAYREIIKRPPILECLKDSLPVLVVGKDPTGQLTALYRALENGWVAAIDAYHRFVADPALLPDLAHALPRAFLAEGQWGTPGLAAAMRNGHAAAVAAYHSMLADDAILPCIRPSLPGLLQARSWGETSGLAQALAAGHMHVVMAYHAMLVDRKILPAIAYALPHLLVASKVSGMAGWAEATQHGHAWTKAAYRAMLLDASIGPRIEDAIRRRLSRCQAGMAAGRRPTAMPALPAATASAWEAEVDLWLDFQLGRRPPRPRFLERMALRIQRMVAV